MSDNFSTGVHYTTFTCMALVGVAFRRRLLGGQIWIADIASVRGARRFFMKDGLCLPPLAQGQQGVRKTRPRPPAAACARLGELRQSVR